MYDNIPCAGTDPKISAGTWIASGAGKMGICSKPGLLIQRLTTKEPTEDMVEVAIASVEAVLDWRAYLEEQAKSEK